jgi:signal transduction histidine kinase
VLSDHLTEEDAIRALRHAVPDLDRYLAERSIEIISLNEWYLKGGTFDIHRVIASWNEKLDQALARGYPGMRVSGNTAWLQQTDWRDFREYEKEVDVLIANQPMIVLCTYPLTGSHAADILDVARLHQIAVARRNGDWEIVETPELKQAKQAIQQLNAELEHRVSERTRELIATNAALQRETGERQQAEAERSHLYEQMQSLSHQLLQVQEAERRTIARELHDEIGQRLTGLSMLLSMNQQFPPEQNQSRQAQAQAIIGDLIEQVRNLALDLRPAILDDFGLVPALVWLFERYTMQTHVAVRFEHSELEEQRFAPDVETTAYRIVQEALTNVARHAGVTDVTVRLWTDGDSLSMMIVDQGRGFDPQAVRTSTSIGLAGMAERAALLGGDLTIESVPGAGTRVTAVLPS